MPKIVPNFTEAATGELAEGVYKARITDAVIQDQKEGRTDTTIRWTLQVFGADGELARYNNWKITHFTDVTGKMADKFRKLALAATGTVPTETEFDTDTLMGKEVYVTVAHAASKTDPTRKYVNVKSVAPIA